MRTKKKQWTRKVKKTLQFREASQRHLYKNSQDYKDYLWGFHFDGKKFPSPFCSVQCSIPYLCIILTTLSLPGVVSVLSCFVLFVFFFSFKWWGASRIVAGTVSGIHRLIFVFYRFHSNLSLSGVFSTFLRGGWSSACFSVVLIVVFWWGRVRLPCEWANRPCLS